jgi:hypothetical protein
MDRETFNKYIKLYCCASQLVDYFYNEFGEYLFIDYYKFCEDNANNESFKLEKVSDKVCEWRWQVSFNGGLLTKGEIYNLLKEYDTSSDDSNLTDDQIRTISDILKLFVNKSDLFVDNGEIDCFKKVNLPYTDREITANQIIDIRRKLKKSLTKK